MAGAVTAKALAGPDVWRTATGEGRDAYRALAYHINWRFSRDEHAPLEDRRTGPAFHCMTGVPQFVRKRLEAFGLTLCVVEEEHLGHVASFG
jgi:hypothetical protein